MKAVLALRGISKSFSGVEVLHSIDLDFYPGEVLALLGENGAGKSTLMNIVSGNLQSDSGAIHWDGAPIEITHTALSLRIGIAHIHQELSCIGALTVMENLFLNDYCSGRFGLIDRRAMLKKARALLARVGGEHISPEAEVVHLGIADQQIVEIAKAISRHLRLLIMDEPTSSLTAHEAAALFRIVRELRASGVSIVFISHRLEEALELADRAAVLRDGTLVSDRPIHEASTQSLISDMAGRAFTFAERKPVQPLENAPVLLEVKQVTERTGLGPFSFSLRAGEVLGIFGLVSSGRSELLELLCGIRHPASGEIILYENHPTPASPVDSWRRGIAFLPEGRKKNGIFPQLTVAENIALSARNVWRVLFTNSRSERDSTNELYNRLKIRATGQNQEILYLSGGNQQKTILARCLAVRPRILLLDEPTHGVDVRTKAELYRMIDELAAQGLGIVLVSSELPEIRALASTILVLAGGKLVFQKSNTGLDDRVLLEAAFQHNTMEISKDYTLNSRN
ncbi:MAG: sugar ABC transporter ATP-binding protein [Verrucomicrobia bacterium]|nr:sugar ABC transporter ATP-binding protein [Verrucomicrobiota bacterium]